MKLETHTGKRIFIDMNIPGYYKPTDKFVKVEDLRAWLLNDGKENEKELRQIDGCFYIERLLAELSGREQEKIKSRGAGSSVQELGTSLGCTPKKEGEEG